MGRGAAEEREGLSPAKREGKPIRLWLDDERDPAVHRPGEAWVWVKTVDEAKQLMRRHPVMALALDNDLGEGEDGREGLEGYYLTVWLAEHDLWPTEEIIVHSQNSVAAERMVKGLMHDSRGRYRALGRRLIAN